MDLKGLLSIPDYQTVCSMTQIITCDLIIKNHEGKFLLGMRKNPPAANIWFIPGGRVFKGESIPDGLKRVITNEMGCAMSECKMKGVYEHYYRNESPLGTTDIDTHYIVFAVEGNVDDTLFDEKQFGIQHSDIKWMTKEEILSRDDVHRFTKAYFVDKPPNKFL